MGAYGNCRGKSWEPAQLLVLDWQDDSAEIGRLRRGIPSLRNKAKYLVYKLQNRWRTWPVDNSVVKKCWEIVGKFGAFIFRQYIVVARHSLPI